MNEKRIEALLGLVADLFNTGIDIQNRVTLFQLLIEKGYEVKYGFSKRRTQQDKVLQLAIAFAYVSLEAALLDMTVGLIRDKVDGARELLLAELRYFDLVALEVEKVELFHSTIKTALIFLLLDTEIDFLDNNDCDNLMKFTYKVYNELIPVVVREIDCGVTRRTLNKVGEDLVEDIIEADFKEVPKLIEKISESYIR